MKKKKLLVWIGLLSVLSMSCDDTFNPHAPYKGKLVVFGVFSDRSDTQYVRVHTTVPVPTDLLGPTTVTSDADAEVRIRQGTRTFAFRDTTLPRADTSRYRSPVRVYVGYHIALEPGARYELLVSSPSKGTATASAIALFRGSMIQQTDFNGNVNVQVLLAQVGVRAWVVQMFLDCEIRVDTGWVTQLIEVPRFIDPLSGERVFPKPLPTYVSTLSFPGSAIADAKQQIIQRNPGRGFRTRRHVFVLTQLDEAYYAYYSTVNGFPDSGTLRLDESDYTNIIGGLGVFAMSTQTVQASDTTGRTIVFP